MSRQPKTQRNATSAKHVRRARIPSDLTYDKMSELGRALFDLSQTYEADGEELLSEAEIERELARRRGLPL